MKATPPSPIILDGRTVQLVPLTVNHADELFPSVDANHEDGLKVWTYIPDGPFFHPAPLREHFANIIASPDLFLAIIDKRQSLPTITTGKPAVAGYLALMNSVPDHRRLEIGHVILSPALQRTTGASEALFLALDYTFRLGNVRVEWKCDVRNEASRRAAARLGFQAEGVFRRHMWVRGETRDTAWFSMLREEWEGENEDGGVKGMFGRWLDRDNFDAEGRQKKTLQELRFR